jgi:N-acyl homoserine lactone hydrolase
VKPADVTFVAISHTHPDHIGNVDMFPASTLLIQKPQVDWPSPKASSRLSKRTGR